MAPKKNRHIITQLNEAGLLEGINELTGEVIWTQSPTRSHDKEVKRLEKRAKEAKSKKAKELAAAKRQELIGYTPEKGRRICELIAEGYTMTEVGRMEEMPSRGAMSNWLRRHKLFNVEYYKAKTQRAEAYHDEAVDIARNVRDKDDVPIAKLQVDTLKWAAQVNSPENFSGKTKQEEGVAPVTININTGIVRPEDNAIEADVVSSEEVDE